MVDIDGDMANQEISCDGKELLYYFQYFKLCMSSSRFGFLCFPIFVRSANVEVVLYMQFKTDLPYLIHYTS
jgi:hypothetical protein